MLVLQGGIFVDQVPQQVMGRCISIPVTVYMGVWLVGGRSGSSWGRPAGVVSSGGGLSWSSSPPS